jgi:hypothetical protein
MHVAVGNDNAQSPLELAGHGDVSLRVRVQVRACQGWACVWDCRYDVCHCACSYRCLWASGVDLLVTFFIVQQIANGRVCFGQVSISYNHQVCQLE